MRRLPRKIETEGVCVGNLHEFPVSHNHARRRILRCSPMTTDLGVDRRDLPRRNEGQNHSPICDLRERLFGVQPRRVRRWNGDCKPDPSSPYKAPLSAVSTPAVGSGRGREGTEERGRNQSASADSLVCTDFSPWGSEPYFPLHCDRWPDWIVLRDDVPRSGCVSSPRVAARRLPWEAVAVHSTRTPTGFRLAVAPP